MPKRPGVWRLWGEVNGVQIRKRGRLEKLEPIKVSYEKDLAEQDQQRQVLRLTWLSVDQLRDAEAAVQRSGAIRLLDRVIASEKVMPSTAAVACAHALSEWIKHLKAKGRFARTIEKNEDRIKHFLKFSRDPKHLADITPEMSEAWVFRDGTEGYTPLTDANVLQGWLRFCRRRRWLAIIPFEIDMKDLAESSKSKSPPRILKPSQVEDLATASATVARGRLLAYMILTTWLKLRHAEALRTTPDLIRFNATTPHVRVHPRKRGTASNRRVTIPVNVRDLLKQAMERHGSVIFSKTQWETIRAAAGLIKLGKTTRGKRRPILESQWQENLLRHTGISYHHQHTGGDLKEVCREAGNSDDTTFRHYLDLPDEGDDKIFYGSGIVRAATEAFVNAPAGAADPDTQTA